MNNILISICILLLVCIITTSAYFLTTEVKERGLLWFIITMSSIISVLLLIDLKKNIKYSRHKIYINNSNADANTDIYSVCRDLQLSELNNNPNVQYYTQIKPKQ